MEERLDHVCHALDEILRRLDAQYVTKAEFCPVRQVVYGLVSLILIGVVGAVIGLVIS